MIEPVKKSDIASFLTAAGYKAAVLVCAIVVCWALLDPFSAWGQIAEMARGADSGTEMARGADSGAEVSQIDTYIIDDKDSGTKASLVRSGEVELDSLAAEKGVFDKSTKEMVRGWFEVPKEQMHRWSVYVDLGSSLLTDANEASYFAETIGVGVTVGYRLSERFTILVHVEQNVWRAQDNDDIWNSGVFNFGGGIDYEIFSPYVHASAMFGLSVLTFDTVLDHAGSVGDFVDFAPIDIRFYILKRFVVSLFPLTLRIEAPVTHSPEIYYIQYRTVVRFGVLF